MKFDPNNLCYEMIRIYSENKTPDNKITICNEGGSRCFHSGQLIVTDKGSLKISDIKKGDLVLSYNHNNGKNEYKRVESCLVQSNSKKAYRIILKSGKEIICTHDHKFYFMGRYIEIEKLILSLQ